MWAVYICKHPAQKGEDLKRCLHCHITHYCSVQCQRKDICLCGCGQEVGHCESLILYHKDLYIFVKVSQVTIFYSSLDTFINTYTTPKGGAPAQAEYTSKKERKK